MCTHVSIAVAIANRYLQRDYNVLDAAGIAIKRDLFTLDEMVVKFEHLEASGQPALTVTELIDLAKEGKKISAKIALDFLPAVEHFARQDNAQTFLSGEITATADENIHLCHRGYSCFATESAEEERTLVVNVANVRLEAMFREFQRAGIAYVGKFFK